MHKLIFFAVKYFAFRIFLIKKTELIDPAFKGGGVVRLIIQLWTSSGSMAC
jgi:hypothetical protein